MAERAGDHWRAWATQGWQGDGARSEEPAPEPRRALDRAALHELLMTQARADAQLRAELSGLREQLAELGAELAAMHGTLARLDRDALRAERRDRELLEIAGELQAELAALRAVRLHEAARPMRRAFMRGLLRRRSGGCS